jgi:protein CpxP
METGRDKETKMTTGTTTVSRRWTWLFALPLAGALALPAVTAFARPGHRPEAGEMGAFGGGRRMGKLLDAAGATDAQKAQIKAAWTNLRPQLQALHEQRGKLRDEMKKALAASTIDPAAVERLRKEEVQLTDRASTLVTQGMVQSAQVLTPEQRQKLAAQLDQQHAGAPRGE